MSPRTGRTQIENPICITNKDLPPPPEIGAAVDPAEPHPDEPGAPDDCPACRQLPDAD